MRAKITKRWWIFRLWLTSLVIIIIVELVQWLLFPIIFACSPPVEGSPVFSFSSRDCARPSISPWADASQQLVCRVAIARQFGFASVLVLSRLFVCYPAPSQMIKCLLVFASPRDRSFSHHLAPSLALELFRLSLQKSLTASRFPVLSALLSLSPKTRRTFAQFSDNLCTIFSGRFNSSSHRLRDLFAVFIQDSRT